MKIAHVSTFPQMRCGIALYAADLITALPYVEHVKYALHYGINFSNDSALDAGQLTDERPTARVSANWEGGENLTRAPRALAQLQ